MALQMIYILLLIILWALEVLEFAKMFFCFVNFSEIYFQIILKILSSIRNYPGCFRDLVNLTVLLLKLNSHLVILR